MTFKFSKENDRDASTSDTHEEDEAIKKEDNCAWAWPFIGYMVSCCCEFFKVNMSNILLLCVRRICMVHDGTVPRTHFFPRENV